MVIHTKKKLRIHFQPERSFGSERFRGGDKDLRESKQPIKLNKRSIKLAGTVGVKVVTEQLDGGEEVQQAAGIAHSGSRLITDTASKGADIFKSKELAERKRKLKVVESGKRKQDRNFAGNAEKSVSKNKIERDAGKKSTKGTAKTGAKDAGDMAGKATRDKQDRASPNRTRRLKFFMDKMKPQEEQNDNIIKVAKDFIVRQAMLVMKKVMASITGYLLALFLMIAIAALPVVAFVAIIYNSPLATFFPPLEDGDTIISVTKDYETDFNQTVTALANEHSGCDAGEVVYMDYEGLAAVPSNYYDVMAVYMVKYGVGDTATVINDTTKSRLKAVFDDMCSYQTSKETKTDTTILKVNVSLKSYQDMINEYGISFDEAEMLEDLMNPEYLAMIGYTGGTGGGSSGGGNAVSELSASEIAGIVSGISHLKEKQAVSFALSKVGCPYSQAYRDSGSYYDCSSLAYYSWKSAGVDISFGGATTAAAEGQGLEETGKTVEYDEMQPGDLIFYSYCNNGRYKNISHVAVYAGNGKVVEAVNESLGVVYRDASNTGSIVMIGRP